MFNLYNAEIFLHTYVMSLRPLYIIYFFSAVIDFRRRNLTSIDARIYDLYIFDRCQILTSEGVTVLKGLINEIVKPFFNTPRYTNYGRHHLDYHHLLHMT